MKILKIVGIIVVVLLVIVAGGLTYLFSAFPKSIDTPDISVEASPEVIARGEYLANHVSVCMDCHSKKDYRYFSGPPIAGTLGGGGDVFDHETAGFPGTLYPSNISPAALSEWTDAEIARAIVSGIDKDGNALFPQMPYLIYNYLSTQDLSAIVAYLRTLPPVENTVPERELDFPLNLIVRTMPVDYEPKAHPDTSNSVEYGSYLVKIAGCQFCHTPVDDQMQPIPGMEFAGGHKFPLPNGLVVTSNITPDEETGIGGWDKETFITMFRSYAPEEVKKVELAPDDFNSVMPWSYYADMTDQDLGAIYDYLRTVEPKKNMIDRFTPKAEMAE